MGIFHSCQSTSSSVTTAKLILQNGELQEFSQPVKVSQAMQNVDSASFVCDSDDIDFGEILSAVSEDEELQLGQLYFVLPSNCLNRPILGEEMAALAVKASAALRRIRGGARARCCGSKGLETLEFAIKKDLNTHRRVAAADATIGGSGGGGRESVRERRVSGSGGGGGGGCTSVSGRVGRRRFMAKLTVIVEELEELKQPLKAAQVLSRTPNCFLCSSESMFVGAHPPQLGPDDYLQLGQIYFLLPLSHSRAPLSLPDLCALAIKASSALSRSSCRGSIGIYGYQGHCRKVPILDISCGPRQPKN
ncbi:hypothetical protein TorRG33x02_330300 [Trema orientale]|uniref:DUF4228 domain protein n=1 Tax=Trema orientale TaxID=63057 RepID=A0A2P5B7G3_TREOI|nr:hypothetical protein TorRG33x02_330300 [Trema orientale]